MSERKTTPGPWEINPAEPTQIMTSEKPHELICRTPPKLYANRAEANARLIAAAPDLLEALEALLKLHEAHHNCPEHAAARAVVAKAKGQTP